MIYIPTGMVALQLVLLRKPASVLSYLSPDLLESVSNLDAWMSECLNVWMSGRLYEHGIQSWLWHSRNFVISCTPIQSSAAGGSHS